MRPASPDMLYRNLAPHKIFRANSKNNTKRNGKKNAGCNRDRKRTS